MSRTENVPAAAEATSRDAHHTHPRTSHQEAHSGEAYPLALLTALSLDGIRVETTRDFPPVLACPWCGSGRSVTVDVEFMPDELDEPVNVDACRECAPALLRQAHELSLPGVTVVAALVERVA